MRISAIRHIHIIIHIIDHNNLRAFSLQGWISPYPTQSIDDQKYVSWLSHQYGYQLILYTQFITHTGVPKKTQPKFDQHYMEKNNEVYSLQFVGGLTHMSWLSKTVFTLILV